MNLLLHGLDAPQIDPNNALRFKLSEIGEKDRVDVILTNPPFGGEEEKGIQGNFPEDRQTSETALLFLQLIMRKLKRNPSQENDSLPPRAGGGLGRGVARAAVVAPNGTLFGDGVCARLKQQLLTDFNLHTIVRLPNGVFNPYTGIKTNLLFFTKGQPTQEVWYYEHPYPEGAKSYNKGKPIRIEEFKPEKKWWGKPDKNGLYSKRKETEQAWRVSFEDIKAGNYNLDLKNPHNADTGPGRVEDLLPEYESLLAQIGETRSKLKQELHHALMSTTGLTE
jgi:type I restriction enzyme M protein